MPAAPSIRPAGLLDVGAVLELWSLARTPYSQTPDTLAGLERLIEHSPGALLVAELDGRVVGTLIAAWDGWRGTMYRLAVHPGSRRRGIARRLVGAGEERLRGLGALRITALVAREDERARDFWAAAGYLDDPKTGRFVKNPQSS